LQACCKRPTPSTCARRLCCIPHFGPPMAQHPRDRGCPRQQRHRHLGRRVKALQPRLCCCYSPAFASQRPLSHRPIVHSYSKSPANVNTAEQLSSKQHQGNPPSSREPERLAQCGRKPRRCAWLKKALHGPEVTGARARNRGIRSPRVLDFKQYDFNTVPPQPLINAAACEEEIS